MAQTGTRKRGRATATKRGIDKDSADSDQPSNPKRPNKAKKTSRPTRNRGSSTGLAENDLQGPIQAAKQCRKGASDAIRKIRSKRDEVLRVIEEERHRFNDGRGGTADGNLADSLATECALHSHDPIMGCEAFEEAKRTLQRFQSLATRYDAVNNKDSGPAEPRWMRWKQDVLDLTALNNRTKKLACQVAEGHLAPNGWPELLADPQAGDKDQELEQIAMEILDQVLPKGAATWGTAAAQLVDVYGSMLKDTF